MPLDANIILQGKMPQVDLMDIHQKGLNMRQLAMQNQKMEQDAAESASMQDILKRNVVTDPTGKSSLNQGSALSDLYKVHPERAMAFKKMIDTYGLEEMKTISEKSKMLAWSTTPENYQQTRQKGIEMGLPNFEMLPEMYLPSKVEAWKLATLDGEKQIDAILRENDLKEKRADRSFDRQIQMGKLGIERQKMTNEMGSGEKLPLDSKHFVNALSTKNASKVSIQNQIDSVLETAKDQPVDQKLAAYNGLIKTLNSQEGADAVGVEEAARLAGKLQFAMGNLTNNNPMQFGRDIEGFEQQAKNVSKSVAGAVKANQKLIDEKMGRSPMQKSSEPTGITPEQAMQELQRRQQKKGGG